MISCQFEDGAKANLRHVVVDAIVLNAARDKILLIKRAPHLSNGNKYGLCGGYLDRDETLEQALHRELMEETGYTGKTIALFKIIDTPNRKNDERQNVAFMYIVEAVKKVGDPDDEVTELKWCNFTDLPPKDQFAFDHYETIAEYLKSKNV